MRLRAAKAAEFAKRTKRSKISVKAVVEGNVGTRNAMQTITALRQIANSPKNPNAIAARQLEIIWEHMRDLEYTPPGQYIRAFNDATNNLIRADRKKKLVVFSKRQQEAIRGHFEYAGIPLPE